MNYSEQILHIANQHNCKFVSFKYLGNSGNLEQIDYPITVIKDKDILSQFEITHIFFDPFRAISTISVFCAPKIESARISRDRLLDLTQKGLVDGDETIISFWIQDNELESKKYYAHQADPKDLYANLRSEICLMLDQLGFQVISHQYGASIGECVINIKAKNLVDLLDNIIVSHFFIENCATNYNLRCSFASKRSGAKIHLNIINQRANKVRNWQIYAGCSAEIYQNFLGLITQ